LVFLAGGIVVPFVASRLLGRSWDWLFPEYAVSVDICVVRSVITGAFVGEQTGQRLELTPEERPSPFTFLIKNTGDKYLDDANFLILFTGLAPRTEIEHVEIGSGSPLDKAFYKASRDDNVIRVTAKRMNPGDFIFGDGVASGGVVVEVFSSSVGLTTRARGAPAECALWRPRQPTEVFLLLRETSIRLPAGN
jgi:hypothetical protein